MFQFRLRSILLLTFVVAVCGALMRLSPVVGIIAAIALSIALLRTFKQLSQHSNVTVVFLRSVGLLLGLAVFSILSVMIGSLALALMAAHWSLSLIQRVTVFVCRRVRQSRLAGVPLALMRGTIVCVTAILVGSRYVAVGLAIWLSKVNYEMLTSWLGRRDVRGNPSLSAKAN